MHHNINIHLHNNYVFTYAALQYVSVIFGDGSSLMFLFRPPHVYPWVMWPATVVGTMEGIQVISMREHVIKMINAMFVYVLITKMTCGVLHCAAGTMGGTKFPPFV